MKIHSKLIKVKHWLKKLTCGAILLLQFWPERASIFLHTLFLENEERPSQKRFRAMFLRYNEAYMPKFSYFLTLSKCPKNLGDVLARGLSIIVKKQNCLLCQNLETSEAALRLRLETGGPTYFTLLVDRFSTHTNKIGSGATRAKVNTL